MKSPTSSSLLIRSAFVFLLAGLIASTLDAQPPTGTQPKKQPDKKNPDKKEPDKKDPDKKDPPEIKWPTEIGGKDIKAIIKECSDPDPTVREFGLRTLPGFGPAAQKAPASKAIISRMNTKVESDPGVRIAAFNVAGVLGFDAEADWIESRRLLISAVNRGTGLERLHAVQALGLYGPKGEGAITALTGVAMRDPSYETRRAIAQTLGRIGFNEKSGPNMKALTALADTLASDASAAVRMEALQSLMLLGPPWAGVLKPGDKQNPPINTKDAAVITRSMRIRIGDPKTKPPTPPKEKDNQVEIWCRLVLMRFDLSEVNEENLNAFAKHLSGADIGVKLQALQALGLMGEGAAKKLDEVIRVLNDKEMPRPVTATTINVLMAMGAAAKPAIPELKKMAAEIKAAAAKKIKPEQAGEKAADEEFVKLIELAIKHIDEAKPTSPSSGSKDPKEPKKP
ncbi:MAG: HEAT repeat domain-containing protein [Planctomycetia bacterium]|nr:HEAT repeat domain-containing protein [Planctomycetia bacterium]